MVQVGLSFRALQVSSWRDAGPPLMPDRTRDRPVRDGVGCGLYEIRLRAHAHLGRGWPVAAHASTPRLRSLGRGRFRFGRFDTVDEAQIVTDEVWASR